MTIIDINAWFGSGFTHPVPGSVEQVTGALTQVGVSYICLTPLDAVWYHDPHVLNADLYRTAQTDAKVLAVPLLDPTVVNWADELALARSAGAVMVKLVPAYSGYDMATARPLLDTLAEMNLPVIVQVRLEDPRRQHPLAQVPDFPVAEIADMAARRTGLKVVIGGASSGSILSLRDQLAALPNLYADLSQADGMDAVRRMVDADLLPSLLFGSHAPLFEPLAGLARVLPELDDVCAETVLGRNAAELLGL